MSLGLSPVSAATPSSERIASGERARKGRPPGTWSKQKLAPLGEWMNTSAGLAFTPHVLHVRVGEYFNYYRNPRFLKTPMIVNGVGNRHHGGEKAFCSPECRSRQTSIDEQSDRLRRCAAKKKREYSVSPCSGKLEFIAKIKVTAKIVNHKILSSVL
ncbi:PREDICTED: uncharacterized protein LOC105976914 isoform X2 [Erythranthe guttata]|uniref:uncharacterized protein LOC105976914 isoform X2 n=1 Tax=Erythranthe guttata TaxID=4155 RepID=UPI00064D9957|nr:PREDICTED: uncharacterized protein LOC105976914 isoform X2 [Erythranthe guttata]|eukprot:XP_012857640.1 PREDICTED: uncharacterized protein LOC105976914 isoform X2 [Erythranthe guttata]